MCSLISAKEYKLKLVSIKYPEKLFVNEDKKEIEIPIALNFFNNKMKILLLGEKDYFTNVIEYTGNSCKFYNIPEKNKLKQNGKKGINKDKKYKYEIKTGYSIEIIYNEENMNRKIENQFMEVIKDKYLYHRFRLNQFNLPIPPMSENYEIIFPKDYLFWIKMPDIKMKKSELKEFAGGKIKIVIKNPYIEIYTPIVDPVNNKEYNVIRFVSETKSEISIDLKNVKKSNCTSKIVEKKVKPQILKAMEKRERKFNGYYNKNLSFYKLDSKQKSIYEFLDNNLDIYSSNLRMNLEYYLVDENKSGCKIWYFPGVEKRVKGLILELITRTPHIADVRIKGKLIINKSDEFNIEWIIYNTGICNKLPLSDIILIYNNNYNKIKNIQTSNAESRIGWDIFSIPKHREFNHVDGIDNKTGEWTSWPVESSKLENDDYSFSEASVRIFLEILNKKEIKNLDIIINEFKVNVLEYTKKYIGVVTYRIKYNEKFNIERIINEK
jgi:hypothetical protein